MTMQIDSAAIRMSEQNKLKHNFNSVGTDYQAEDDGSEQRDFGVAPVCPDHDASKDAP